MEIIQKLINCLPKYEEIQQIVQKNPEGSYIIEKSLKVLSTFATNKIPPNEDEVEECSYLTQALADKTWEEIHTGMFSKVAMETRQTYVIANFCKILFLLTESTERSQLEVCSKTLDEAILIGCTQNIFAGSQQFMDILTEFFDEKLDPSLDIQLPVLEEVTRREVKCDILQLNKPSVQEFNDKCFKVHQPALLLNTLQHWPALKTWRNLNYILKLAGNRTVPIEIGSNYATDDWSQQLMKVKDFLQRQFGNKQSTDETTNIEYLAQHELFEQIPQLRKDFSTPDYCMLGNSKESLDIKAWLGPKGTISPMHFDPKHNLLCQVFGSKRIILASPQSTENLYPHDSEFLSNTSQIDAENIDSEKFPNTSQVTFYHVTLQPGDCLYMPPKWWHFVRSEAPSFSVSFWWE